MTIYFAGGEADCFVPLDANSVELATAGLYDATYSRTSLICKNTTSTYWESSPMGAVTPATFWLHFVLSSNSTNSLANGLVRVYNSSGTEMFRLQMVSTTGPTFQLQYWNGSAMTALGTAITIPAGFNNLNTWDIKIVKGASGVGEYYLNGNLVATNNANFSSIDNFHKIRLYGASTDSVSAARYSQIIAADEPTIGMKYYTKPPTANGNYNAWTGTFADVDEVITSDVDFVTTSTADQYENFTGAAISIPSTYTVKAVTVGARIKNDGTGPVNAKHMLRKGGVDYDAASNVTMNGVGYTPTQTVWNTDPSTGVAWTTTDAGAATLEFGVKSQT